MGGRRQLWLLKTPLRRWRLSCRALSGSRRGAPPQPEATPLIEANIQKLGVKLADIKYLLNTHAHMDHTGGLAQLKKASGAQLVSGEKDKPLLEGGYYPGLEKEEVLQFPPVKVDRVVHEGNTVSIGNITLTANETPGHTPGCTSWTTAAKDGDATRSVIFFCSATVALNKLVTNQTYPGIIDDYKKTFAWSGRTTVRTRHPAPSSPPRQIAMRIMQVPVLFIALMSVVLSEGQAWSCMSPVSLRSQSGS